MFSIDRRNARQLGIIVPCINRLKTSRRDTMHRIISILFFYKKLILPSFSMAVALAFLEWLLTGKFSWTSVGIYYILMSMFFHYYFYEKINPGEYYFYYNMGLSKFILWGSSLFLSLIIVLIVMIVWLICKLIVL